MDAINLTADLVGGHAGNAFDGAIDAAHHGDHPDFIPDPNVPVKAAIAHERVGCGWRVAPGFGRDARLGVSHFAAQRCVQVMAVDMGAGGDVVAGPTDDGTVLDDRAARFDGRQREFVAKRNVVDQARHVRSGAPAGRQGCNCDAHPVVGMDDQAFCGSYFLGDTHDVSHPCWPQW